LSGPVPDLPIGLILGPQDPRGQQTVVRIESMAGI